MISDRLGREPCAISRSKWVNPYPANEFPGRAGAIAVPKEREWLMMKDLIVELHDGVDAALRADWLRLLESCGWTTPFQHPDFVEAAAAMAAGESCPAILTAREPGNAPVRGVLALGMAKQRIGPLRLATIRSVSLHRHDLTTTLADPDWASAVSRSFAAFLGKITVGGRQLQVRGVPVRDPLLAQLGQEWKIDLPSPLREAVLRGAGSWEDVIMNGHQRREIRRVGRKLAREHGWEVRWAGSSSESRDLFRDFSDLYVHHQRERGRDNLLLATSQARQALEALLVEWVPRGLADIGTLNLDGGSPIAGYILFHSNRNTWAYRTCFALEWGRYAPGSLMLAAAVDRSIQRGSTRYDFGWGDQAYKRYWSSPVGDTVRISMTPGLRQMPFRALSRLGIPVRSFCRSAK